MTVEELRRLLDEYPAHHSIVMEVQFEGELLYDAEAGLLWGVPRGLESQGGCTVAII